MDTPKFTISLKKQPVEIDGKIYTVVELTGKQRDAFLNTSANRVKLDDKGNAVGMRNFDGIHTHLVSMCLRDPEDKLVPESTIKEWPATAVEALFKLSQTLSGLGDPGAAAEVAKNG